MSLSSLHHLQYKSLNCIKFRILFNEYNFYQPQTQTVHKRQLKECKLLLLGYSIENFKKSKNFNQNIITVLKF